MSVIPLYTFDSPQLRSISLEGAKLLVKRKRALWVDQTDRSKGIEALPKDVVVRQQHDHATLVSPRGQAPAHYAHFRERFIDPEDQMKAAAALFPDDPQKQTRGMVTAAKRLVTVETDYRI